MPRKKPMLSTTVVNDVVEVNSKAYGKHYRAPRGTKTAISINDSFQKSIDLNKAANPIAKAIKDSIDPFFKNDFKDGTLWSRLVGLFKKHLAQRSDADFRILEKFELFKYPRMASTFQFDADVTVLNESDPVIQIDFSTAVSVYKYNVTRCRQTLIVIFLDADSKATTVSEEITYPLQTTEKLSAKRKQESRASATHKQLLKLPLPPGTKWALMVVKCDPLRKSEEIGLMKLRRIKIVKVYEVV